MLFLLEMSRSIGSETAQNLSISVDPTVEIMSVCATEVLRSIASCARTVPEIIRLTRLPEEQVTSAISHLLVLGCVEEESPVGSCYFRAVRRNVLALIDLG